MRSDPQETLWFYAEDGEQHGPLTEVKLRTLLDKGRLSAKTLVWSEGMANWVAAERVEVLTGLAAFGPSESASVPPPPPRPVLQGEVVDGQGAIPTGEPVRSHAERAGTRSKEAWRRFLARNVDISLAGMGLALITAGASVSFAWSPLFLVGLLGGWCAVEAALLSRFGMTPGKWVFRIRVVHRSNRLLTFQEALQRSVGVYLSGMALGFPMVQQLFNVLAYKEFVEFGRTSWDTRAQSQVQFATMRPVHLGFAIAWGTLVLISILSMSSQVPR